MNWCIVIWLAMLPAAALHIDQELPKQINSRNVFQPPPGDADNTSRRNDDTRRAQSKYLSHSFFNNGYWRVSDSAKAYTWVLREGTMPTFTQDSFCGALQGNLLFVGDSVSQGHYNFLTCGDYGSCGVVPRYKWYPQHLDELGMHHPKYGDLVQARYVCHGQFIVGFVRNDILSVGSTLDEYGLDVETGSRLCNASANSYRDSPFICFIWSHSDLLQQFSTIVMNTGLHFREDNELVHGIKDTVSYMAGHVTDLNQKAIFFRRTVPGFADCEATQDMPPFKNVSSAEEYIANHPWYQGPLFKHQNELIEDLFLDAGFGVIDTYTPSILLRHGRKSNKDCAHFKDPVYYKLWDNLLLGHMEGSKRKRAISRE